MKTYLVKNHLPRHRAFSLMEVLLAVFILGIGLIMVITIFPVGAEWTRQSTETSVSQTIAQNAFAIVKTHYGRGGDLQGQLAGITTTTLQPLPGFTNIPVTERCYLHGSPSPFPVPADKVANCTYYWTALGRLSPDPLSSSSLTKKYEIYILVFNKGAREHLYTPSVLPTGFTEITGSGATSIRDQTNPMVNSITIDRLREPTLIQGTRSDGTTPPILPPTGVIGLGVNSGTVFRHGFDVATNKAVARPGLAGNEPVIYAIPADNTSASPLVYVFQTTLSQ
jgi:type II secretory pathway pseudopilin PulG